MPAHVLVLFAIVSLQLGAALAVHLFPVLGASGTVAVRIVFSALLLGLAARVNVRVLGRALLDHWPLLIVFGLSIACMNYFFFQAIARIPLGAAVALEFVGPLGVAVFTSRRLNQFGWVALAALGIVLLSPLSGVDLDSLGVFFALVAGTGWAVFILIAARVSKQIPGSQGLALGMAVAAITMIPFAIPAATKLFAQPYLLLAGLGVALLSTSIPFSFEFAALKRLSARTYGILVSLEPAVAAIVGAVFLGERIGVQGVTAVACVVVAAVGISVSDAKGGS